MKILNEALVFNFQLIGFLNDDLLNGLRKGLTAAIEYQIQVWKIRPRWVDELAEEKFIRMKIGYDTWEQRYMLARADGRIDLTHEDRLKERCSTLQDYPLIPVSDMEDGSEYYITVKAVLQPMSVENYQEIKRWLSGEVKELNPKAISSSRSPGKKAGNWLLGLILNLSGFGDRLVSAKSPVFRIQNGTVINQEAGS